MIKLKSLFKRNNSKNIRDKTTSTDLGNCNSTSSLNTGNDCETASSVSTLHYESGFDETDYQHSNLNIPHGQNRRSSTKNDKNGNKNGFDNSFQSGETSDTMQELQSHIERLSDQKRSLEGQVLELIPLKTEIMELKLELKKMQNMQEMSNSDIQKLNFENETLRNRLRDVVNSPLSDAEKHKIIQDSQRLHSSAPASIALPNSVDNDSNTCITPDWDKHSSSSEVSVACLQDKIIQMEETHYSTNEELQATLQELSDLQNQLYEMQQYTERLSDEKDVIFQSLCRQTEKLDESRTQITTLQELLLRESDQAEITNTECETKLLDLLKNAQEERETLLLKQKEINSELIEKRQSLQNLTDENVRLQERIGLLETTVETANAERKLIENQLSIAKDENSKKVIEISRLNTLLDNARSKIDELQNDRAMGDKTDFDEILDVVRKEKDLLEINVASLQEQNSKSQVEIQKLKDQIVGLNEEVKVARNNAKCAVSHLEYKYEQLTTEKQTLTSEYQKLQDESNELKIQSKCHMEDRMQLDSLLAETQKHLSEAERSIMEKNDLLDKEKQFRKREAEEWQQFQNDLLMTVRVANDFKTEAQGDKEQLIMDNNNLRNNIRILEQQVDKLNRQMSSADAQNSIITSVEQEMAARRQQKHIITKQDSRYSVKSLIESIEGNKTQENCSSNRNSTSNVNQMSDPNSLTKCSAVTSEWEDNWQNIKNTRETQSSNSSGTNYCLAAGTKHSAASERKDPLNALTKNGGSKRNALLKWCQNKTVGYRNIDITNFSSSWNDGLAFCAILHSYLPEKVPYDTLSTLTKRRNFTLAFSAAESVGIPTTLNINDMCTQERPDWTQVMSYITSIYVNFEI